jgi:F-type H+-transporting ATPase subunit b
MEQHESFFQDPRSWVAIAFVIFFVLFGKKIWAALTAMLDQHTAKIRAELDEAARLRAEAQTMLTEARIQREAALRDAKGLLEAAQAEAVRVGEQARADAEAAGRRREKMATDRIAAAEKAAVTEVRLAAADLASRAAERVIAETLSAEGDSPLVDSAIAGLPAALGRARAA